MDEVRRIAAGLGRTDFTYRPDGRISFDGSEWVDPRGIAGWNQQAHDAPPPEEAETGKPRFFTAGDFRPELMDALQPTQGSPYTFCKVLTVQIGPIAEGSVADAMASAQVSTKADYPLMIASVVRLHEGNGPLTANNLSAWPGHDISEAAGTNIFKEIHHHHIQRADRAECSAFRDGWLSLFVYASSTAYAGDEVTVDADYGRLTAIIWPAGSLSR